MSFFQFAYPFVLGKCRIKNGGVGGRGKVEESAAHGPPGLCPFDGHALGKAPGVGGIVECARVHNRPVHEVRAGIMRVGVGVENIHNGKFTYRQDDIVRSLGAPQLVGSRFDALLFSPHVDDLPVKRAWQPQIWGVCTHLVGFPTRKAGYPDGIAEAKSLIDFRIDPDLAASYAHPGKQRQVCRFSIIVVRV